MSYRNLELDSEFVISLKRQDDKAFETLFHACAGFVFSIAMGLLGRRSAAEDAVQEIFFKAYKALPEFKGEKLSPWLGKIAHNHCIDLLRQTKREVPTAVTPVEDLNLSQSNSVSEELPDFINALSVSEREVVILKKVEGLSYKEISQLTGKKEGTLRNIVLKSLQFLREKVDES
ncbi:MAG: RNA polymerase, sigma-24 subunit, ECF subfamily [uncultured bacterium]|nr:MAG: RNA polymerase, sigma-24 subunit, ECF subfamily [uncultured bacterium]